MSFMVGYFALQNAPQINNSGHGTLVDVAADNPNYDQYDKLIDTIARANPHLTYPGQFNFVEPRDWTVFSSPADFYDNYQANVAKVTLDDIKAVAQKYLNPDQLTLVVVGKPETFDKPRDEFGKVETIELVDPVLE